MDGEKIPKLRLCVVIFSCYYTRSKNRSVMLWRLRRELFQRFSNVQLRGLSQFIEH